MSSAKVSSAIKTSVSLIRALCGPGHIADHLSLHTSRKRAVLLQLSIQTQLHVTVFCGMQREFPVNKLTDHRQVAVIRNNEVRRDLIAILFEFQIDGRE